MSATVPTLEVELALAARCDVAEGISRPRIVVGVDEVGRGALAGPVAVGACALEVKGGEIVPLPDGVRDSKKLTATRREALVEPIMASAHAGAVGWASAAEIDEHGIMPALTLAALRALEGLGLDGEIDAILLDGDVDVLTPALTTPERSAPLVHLQVSADRDCASVSAASILAKVARDAHMVEIDSDAPDYGWASNKGYGSAIHREAIDRLGAHEHHRVSWRLGARHPGTVRAPATQPAAPPVDAAPPAAPRSAPAQPVEAAPELFAPGVLWDDQWPEQDGKERR